MTIYYESRIRAVRGLSYAVISPLKLAKLRGQVLRGELLDRDVVAANLFQSGKRSDIVPVVTIDSGPTFTRHS